MKSSRKLTAIIIEDEAAPRRLLRRLLERHHAGTVEVIAEAEEGPAGLALCEVRRPDIIFLDLNLPGFDGLELLARLQSPSHVIITTADSNGTLEAQREGFDCLLKPVDPEQLGAAIASVAASIATRAT